MTSSEGGKYSERETAEGNVDQAATRSASWNTWWWRAG